MVRLHHRHAVRLGYVEVFNLAGGADKGERRAEGVGEENAVLAFMNSNTRALKVFRDVGGGGGRVGSSGKVRTQSESFQVTGDTVVGGSAEGDENSAEVLRLVCRRRRRRQGSVAASVTTE